MSVRTYIISEDLGTAKELIEHVRLDELTSGEDYFVIECPGIVEYRLHNLYEILSGTAERKFSLVASVPGSEIRRIPDECVKLIAVLPRENIRDVSDRWMQMEPIMVRPHVNRSFAQRGLKHLIDVMQLARQRSKPVFLVSVR